MVVYVGSNGHNICALNAATRAKVCSFPRATYMSPSRRTRGTTIASSRERLGAWRNASDKVSTDVPVLRALTEQRFRQTLGTQSMATIRLALGGDVKGDRMRDRRIETLLRRAEQSVAALRAYLEEEKTEPLSAAWFFRMGGVLSEIEDRGGDVSVEDLREIGIRH